MKTQPYARALAGVRSCFPFIVVHITKAAAEISGTADLRTRRTCDCGAFVLRRLFSRSAQKRRFRGRRQNEYRECLRYRYHFLLPHVSSCVVLMVIVTRCFRCGENSSPARRLYSGIALAVKTRSCPGFFS